MYNFQCRDCPFGEAYNNFKGIYLQILARFSPRAHMYAYIILLLHPPSMLPSDPSPASHR